MAGHLQQCVVASGQPALFLFRKAFPLSAERLCNASQSLRVRVVQQPRRCLGTAGQRGARLVGGAGGSAGAGEAAADVGAAELQATVDGDAEAEQDLKDVQDILEVGGHTHAGQRPGASTWALRTGQHQDSAAEGPAVAPLPAFPLRPVRAAGFTSRRASAFCRASLFLPSALCQSVAWADDGAAEGEAPDDRERGEWVTSCRYLPLLRGSLQPQERTLFCW